MYYRDYIIEGRLYIIDDVSIGQEFGPACPTKQGSYGSEKWSTGNHEHLLQAWHQLEELTEPGIKNHSQDNSCIVILNLDESALRGIAALP